MSRFAIVALAFVYFAPLFLPLVPIGHPLAYLFHEISRGILQVCPTPTHLLTDCEGQRIAAGVGLGAFVDYAVLVQTA